MESGRSRSCRAWPDPTPRFPWARVRGSASGRGPAGAQLTQLEAVGTPAACSIFVIDPLAGSKNSLFTFFQPPSDSIVNSCGGMGNLEANFLNTDLTTGR